MQEENPYEPPQAPAQPTIQEWALIDLSPEEVQAFVGRNVRYYLKKWPVAAGRTETGFNWAAFFLTSLWLAYRKMYRVTLVFYAVIVVESLLEEIVFVGILGRPESPTGLGTIIGFVAAGICGFWGNRWYLSHTRKAVAELRSRGLTGEAYLQALARQGGTNIAASLGFFLLFLAVVVVVLVGTDFLFSGE